jgi:hypothetical protein
MTRRRLALALALALTGVPSLVQTLSCETSGAYRHCFDHHGNESTEERSGDYVHGWDSEGHAWTEWRQGDRTYTWPTRSDRRGMPLTAFWRAEAKPTGPSRVYSEGGFLRPHTSKNRAQHRAFFRTLSATASRLPTSGKPRRPIARARHAAPSRAKHIIGGRKKTPTERLAGRSWATQRDQIRPETAGGVSRGVHSRAPQ